MEGSPAGSRRALSGPTGTARGSGPEIQSVHHCSRRRAAARAPARTGDHSPLQRLQPRVRILPGSGRPGSCRCDDCCADSGSKAGAETRSEAEPPKTAGSRSRDAATATFAAACCAAAARAASDDPGGSARFDLRNSSGGGSKQESAGRGDKAAQERASCGRPEGLTPGSHDAPAQAETSPDSCT